MRIRANEKFFDIIDEYMDHLQYFYNVYADKKPVMELSLPSQKIYAYSYSDYLKALNPRSQKILKKQHSEAQENKEMIVFVKDEVKKTMKSGSFPIFSERTE